MTTARLASPARPAHQYLARVGAGAVARADVARTPAQRREPMSTARLASEPELPKSSVHGLCSTPLRYGYLARQTTAPSASARRCRWPRPSVSGTGLTQEFNALWAERAPTRP